MWAKRILLGAALVTAVAACGNAGSPLVPAADPSFDGGHTLGSGARVGDSAPMETDTTQRGGHTLGAGT